MTRKTTITVIALLVLSFAFGILAGLNIANGGRGTAFDGQIGENTFRAGYEAARKRLDETGFYPAMGAAGMEIKSVSGEVKEIKDGKIALKIRPLEPLSDPGLDIRIVATDSGAKVYRMEQRDPAVFQKEMENFDKLMRERMKDPASLPAEPVMPPQMYEKKEISVSDIKVGDQITVTSDQNIREAKEIKAVEISAQPAPAAPPVMPPAAAADAITPPPAE